MLAMEGGEGGRGGMTDRLVPDDTLRQIPIPAARHPNTLHLAPGLG